MLTKPQRIRALFLLVALEGGFLFLLGYLFWLQVGSHATPSSSVGPIWVWVKRGNIYGRNHYELASNRDMLSISANPMRFSPEQRVKAAHVLGPLLGLSEKTIVQRLSQNRKFVWLKRKVDYALLKPLQDAVRTHRLPAIRFEREQKRFYPNGQLLPHVIGFANFDNQGIDGIERSYDNFIMSYEKARLIHRDGRARPIDPRDIKDHPPDLSNSVVLTIDEMIQYIADSALQKACERWNARSGSAIVMNPRTGEVLAMANYPSFDLNDYGKTEEFRKRNRAIWFTYEPGSGFKTFTIAAALSEGVVTPKTLINCENGRFDYHGKLLRDTHPSGTITVTDILVRSSNIGAAKIAEMLGIQRLGHHIRNFGFGAPTGIDLPFEQDGDLRSLDRWGDEAAGYIGFGHGITVTPLQMLVALNAIANQGVLMKPYIVQEIRDEHGKLLQKVEPTPLRQVLSPQTAQQITQMLEQVVADGTKEAQIADVRVAGKTGTAQKAEKGGYSDEKFVSSFLGFLPAEDPQLSIIVVINEPQGEHLGRKVAAPVFREIASQTLEILAASSQLAYSRNALWGQPPPDRLDDGSPSLPPD